MFLQVSCQFVLKLDRPIFFGISQIVQKNVPQMSYRKSSIVHAKIIYFSVRISLVFKHALFHFILLFTERFPPEGKVTGRER